MGLYAGAGVALRFMAVSLVYGATMVASRPFSKAAASLAGWCSLVHAMIALLVLSDTAPWIIGKNPVSGQVPLWSWIAWGPFHLTNRMFARLAKERKHSGLVVGSATEVWPGWWLGGWYAFEHNRHYSAVVDLCCELPQRNKSDRYMCRANWDGVLHRSDIVAAATFLTAAAADGPVLVHCAHGVGRSTAVMCAALVEAGHFETTAAAFQHCRELRPVVKQSSRLKAALGAWEKAR